MPRALVEKMAWSTHLDGMDMFVTKESDRYRGLIPMIAVELTGI